MIIDYYDGVEWLKSQYSGAKPIFDSVIRDIYRYTTITPGGDANILQRQANKNGGYGAGEDSFTLVYDLDAFRVDKAMNGKLYDLIDIHKDRIGRLNELNQLGRDIKAEIDKDNN